MKARPAVFLFALVPLLAFSLLPLAPMSPAFDAPVVTSGWIQSA